MDISLELIFTRRWIVLFIVFLHQAEASELYRILRQAGSCTDAATCVGLTAAACSFPTVINDCPILCEDPACMTAPSTGCADAPSCSALTVAACANPTIVTECPVLCDNCPKVTTGCTDGPTCVGLTAASCSFPAIVTDCPVLCDNCPKTATGCQSGFELVDTQCLRFSKKPKTWSDAEFSCDQLNATLVVPSNFDVLVDYVLAHNLFYYQYWVGASNQDTGNYQWFDGTDVDDSLWYNGYSQLPFGNFGNDSCVKLHLQSFTSGLIASWDTTCSGNKQMHYICQEE